MKMPSLKEISATIFGRAKSTDIVVQTSSVPCDPQRVAELSIKFIIAAGNNDVAEMKRLRSRGADIDFKANITLGSGTVCVGPQGFSQPEEATNALMVALHNGAFDAAMYLAQTGADATAGRKGNFRNCEEKALDFLLTDHVPESAQGTPRSMADFKSFIDDVFNEESSARRHRNYQTDLYTPAQRVQLFDALVANMRAKGLDPLALVSELTVDNALTWGRSEMVPKLAEIGVEIKDEHFVRAADPYHRPHLAIPTMQAVLDELEEKVQWNDKNRPTMLSVLKTMLDKGLALEPEKQQIADKILTGQALKAGDRELATRGAINKRTPLLTHDR